MAILNALVCVAVLSSSVALDVGTLRLPAGAGRFDPAHPGTRQLLMSALNIQAMHVEVLADNVGLNGGVWVLSDPRRGWGDMVLKLRPVEPELHYELPGEAKHLKSLAVMHPGLARDPDVAFPSRILSCLSAHGSKLGDLIVMPKAPGKTLTRLIFDEHYASQSASEELMAVFETVGRKLQSFHSHYGKQHGDFHSGNIMVDPADGNRITFIDVGGMGLPVDDNDVQHLLTDLSAQSEAYHPNTLLKRGMRRFQHGYQSAPAVQTPLSSGEATVPVVLEALWDVVMDVEDTLRWKHLLMAAIVLLCTPILSRKVCREWRLGTGVTAHVCS